VIGDVADHPYAEIIERLWQAEVALRSLADSLVPRDDARWQAFLDEHPELTEEE
jgi:hypothetical protein